ncbi:hypothetical protein GUITHDRAFT_100621 [Guillardia theta CCMP2712]|uniref:PDZ domain-containing protein n=1 Tax=Guillardia theta (strain CCMP2712) TaxID=905079 RepID=L1JZ95_GUITC|nr:hypothetical protein GUITHDRAFT_100621 [Guillardia theta CCMP2712]EKX53639.1 hypothetical protein GUITHDRAFT_100621 [Guillardia theta CCMP2712]|eukprot:XP_005840619.1 hypothetical protein GUITHDRAFT_100621 [Guillardia theta CCMP2712]
MKEEKSAIELPSNNDEFYGIGLKVDVEKIGELENFIVRGFVEGCESKDSESLESGDVIKKIDGHCVGDKTLAQVLCMVLGPCGTTVTLTVEKKSYQHTLVPAQFSFLPFHEQTMTCRDVIFKHGLAFWTDRSKRDKCDGIKVFGGGQLPEGFEHLEVLRTSVPYNTVTFCTRNVILTRKYKMPPSSLKLIFVRGRENFEHAA